MPLEKREVLPNRFRYVCSTCSFAWPTTLVPESELPPPPKHSCGNAGHTDMKGSVGGQTTSGGARPKPVAVCTHCGAVSYDATQINGRCAEQLAGARCVGVNGSARREDDWKQCKTCAGSGTVEAGPCGYCSATGWIYTRGARRSVR